MTEDDAKTKWCPFARVVAMEDGKVTFHQAAFNRVADGGKVAAYPKASDCIGSACMAWRRHGGYGPTGIPNVASTDGYCGLAGKP